MSDVDFSCSNYAEFRVRNQEIQDIIDDVYKGFKGATLTLASCVVLLLLLLFFCWRSSAVDVAHQ